MIDDGAALLEAFSRASRALPADLARAVEAALWETLPLARRRAARDRLLREAGRLLAGRPWRKATTLAALLRAARRQPARGVLDLDSPQGLVALAVRAYRGNRDLSTAQTYRILCDSARILEMQAPASPSSGVNNSDSGGTMSYRIEAGEDVREKFIAGATASILARSGHTAMIAAARAHPTLGDAFKRVDLDPAEYSGASFEDLARVCLHLDGVRSHRLRGEDLIRAALNYRAANGTSDFAVLLENAVNKIYMGAYALAPVSWPLWCARRSVKDFRPAGFYRQGSFGKLDAVTEQGEVRVKNVPDAVKASITPSTAGNIVGITHRGLALDDTDAFRAIASALGEAAAFSIESDCFALLTANSGLGATYPGDTNPLFYTSRANIGPTGAMTAATIDGARAAMGKQKDPSGNRIVSIRPAIWLGPEELGGQARILNAAEYTGGADNTFREPNVCRGIFSNVIDSPILSASSITRHYLLASPLVAPVFAVAFVGGKEAPSIRTHVDGVGLQMRILIDYGCGLIDFRGAVTCAGV